jgi:hypothetical protein
LGFWAAGKKISTPREKGGVLMLCKTTRHLGAKAQYFALPKVKYGTCACLQTAYLRTVFLATKKVISNKILLLCVPTGPLERKFHTDFKNDHKKFHTRVQY